MIKAIKTQADYEQVMMKLDDLVNSPVGSPEALEYDLLIREAKNYIKKNFE